MSVVLRKNNLDSLNDSEIRFVKALIADDLWRPTQAARIAGYKRPGIAACKLMKKPAISKALGKEQRRRLERLELKADEVLHMLATGLFFNPLSLFKPSADGKWVVEDLDKIPDEIGRCVERVKSRQVEKLLDDGTMEVTTYFELEMMGKTKLLELAMKHCGVDGTQKIEYSGNVDLQIGLSAGLNGLLEQVEATRSGQVIDGKVLDSQVVDVEE